MFWTPISQTQPGRSSFMRRKPAGFTGGATESADRLHPWPAANRNALRCVSVVVGSPVCGLTDLRVRLQAWRGRGAERRGRPLWREEVLQCGERRYCSVEGGGIAGERPRVEGEGTAAWREEVLQCGGRRFCRGTAPSGGRRYCSVEGGGTAVWREEVLQGNRPVWREKVLQRGGRRYCSVLFM
ncbi:hypothetical protein CesoFtcFv8_011972 [Champsocephalus esox]|uniref:Uncharacterized protein n=1 Tax=Champsocephalus esox TaxID=159716 RepID=A0AAN8C251_9TELE|nr:hypothetical protein CesoFtcFv8_011972 [Champsocephalus esox]